LFGVVADEGYLVQCIQVSGPVCSGFSGDGAMNTTFGTWSVSGDVSATPLPAALPLFAGGLGAIGLLGWRRNRRNASSAAPS